jgi:GTP-binding protein
VEIVDKVEIKVKAGDGGNGAVSFRHEKFVPLGGPDGGDGGRGGNVYLKAERDVSNLSTFRYKKIFKAESGKNGTGQKKYGKKGNDLEIVVPLGTVVHRIENEKQEFIVDLCQQGQKVIIAKGGRGGLGNVHFATSTNQAPRNATHGTPGEEVRLILDLRLIADVGIIGFPNVGKSTLLSSISAAKPKVADYPFTTLEPVLGEARVGKKNFVIAEIPGLIEGAYQGRGLGHDFLRHAERTKLLLHLLDGTSLNIIDDMDTLNKELESYKPILAEKPQVVAVNKIDLPSVQSGLLKMKDMFKKSHIKAHFISGVTRQGVPELLAVIAERIDILERNEEKEPEVPTMVFRPKPRTRRG